MRYSISLCVGFLAGIIVSAFTLSDAGLFFCLIVAVALCVYARFFEYDHVRIVGFIISLFFLGVFLGQFRVLAFNHSISHDLDQFESSNVSVIGKIISEPISNGETQKFTIAALKISNDVTKGNVLVTTELFPLYHYGDVIEIKGQLKKPEIVDEGNGRIFDYPSYLLKDKITHTISFASIEPVYENQNTVGYPDSSRSRELGIVKNEGNPLIKFLYRIKESFVTSMQKVLPEPEAGLLAGITLGTQAISKNLSNDFRTAGLSHIVVLSGYNITIVADSAMALMLFLAPAYASFVAVVCVVLFVLMAGAGASALRAGIMAIVALLGKRFGKSYDSGRALFFAAFLMILWNPMTLLYDPSFHLSFLATVAMIYFSPIVCGKLKFIHGKLEEWGIKEMLATTLAVNLFVLPYILYMSGNIQILSLPTNLIVLPFVSLTMFLGMAVGVLGFFGRFVGLIAGIPSYIILYYDIFIAQTVSGLPFAQLSISYFPLWIMLTIYSAFFCFLYKRNSVTSVVTEFIVYPTKVMTSDGYVVVGD